MEVESLLLKLLSFDTSNPPGNIKELAEFVENLMKSKGFWVERFPEDSEKFNLIAWKGDVDFAVVAHMDTVPFSGKWRYNPLGERVGNLIYGRGAVDTKGGMASAISAMLKAGKGFLVLTFDEEVGLEGAKLLRTYSMPEKVLVTEPTSLNLGIAHRGVLEVKVALEGKAAHASMPEKGDNAIYKACEVINAIQGFEYREHSLLGKTSFNVGKIAGGEKTNIVPDYCELSTDFRFVPGDDIRIINFLKKFGKVEVVVDLKPFLSNGDFADEFLKIAEKINPGSAKVVLPFYTEAGVLSGFGKDCVVFGPGKSEQAHVRNEHVEIRELKIAEKIYFEMLKSNFL